MSSAFMPIQKICAPGKIVILGEHAINYGSQAICSTISSKLCISSVAGRGRVSVMTSPNTQHDFALHLLGICAQSSRSILIEQLLDQLVTLAAKIYQAPLEKNFDLSIEFGFSPLVGLGGSAALSVGLAKFFAQLQQSKTILPSNILELAIAIETIFHGPTSGMDVKTIFYDSIGLINQQKEFIPIPNREFTFCIGYSGQPKDTKEQVAKIEKSYVDSPTVFKSYMSSIGELVKEGIIAIEEKNLPQLGQLLNKNQLILSDMGLSTPSINLLCKTALSSGALGAKLTGAGGGGCVIALVDHLSRPVVEKNWSLAGFDYFCETVPSIRKT